MVVGVTLTLQAVVLDTKGQALTPQPEIAFHSSARGVLMVTSTGTLTALAPGTAFVTAEVPGDSRFRPDSVTVLVIQPL